MLKIGIVGVGKIVQDQHLPAIYNNPSIDLIATASRHGSVGGIPSYHSIEQMIAATPELDAVALCMPPQYRYTAARCALLNGLHTLLEKPPGGTVCEVEELVRLANDNNVSLFATWHSRYAAAVQSAKLALQETRWQSAQVTWKEDVRKWHPGQEWIWQAGGLGVFDPGINGLSILTEILPSPMFVKSSRLLFPENKSSPIAAQMCFSTPQGADIALDFDWRQSEAEEWTISVKTSAGLVTLKNGGADLLIDDELQVVEKQNEYEAIYQTFVALVNDENSDVDLTPLKLVADAFMLGERSLTEAFVDESSG